MREFSVYLFDIETHRERESGSEERHIGMSGISLSIMERQKAFLSCY